MYAAAYHGSMYSAEVHRIADQLICAHADVNIVNTKGQTALVLAASGKRPRYRLVGLLKASGAQHFSSELERLTGRLDGVPEEEEEETLLGEDGSNGKDEGFATFESFESCDSVGLTWQPIDAKPINEHALAAQYAMLQRVEAKEDAQLRETEGQRADVMDPQYAMLLKVELEEEQRLRSEGS